MADDHDHDRDGDDDLDRQLSLLASQECINGHAGTSIDPDVLWGHGGNK